MSKKLTRNLEVKSKKTHQISVNKFLTERESRNLLLRRYVIFFRPKSVPNSPSIPRAFSNLRHQLTSAWGGSSKKKQQTSGSTGKTFSAEDKKKFPSSLDCSSNFRLLFYYDRFEGFLETR